MAILARLVEIAEMRQTKNECKNRMQKNRMHSDLLLSHPICGDTCHDCGPCSHPTVQGRRVNFFVRQSMTKNIGGHEASPLKDNRISAAPKLEAHLAIPPISLPPPWPPSSPATASVDHLRGACRNRNSFVGTFRRDYVPRRLASNLEDRP